MVAELRGAESAGGGCGCGPHPERQGQGRHRRFQVSIEMISLRAQHGLELCSSRYTYEHADLQPAHPCFVTKTAVVQMFKKVGDLLTRRVEFAGLAGSVKVVLLGRFLTFKCVGARRASIHMPLHALILTHFGWAQMQPAFQSSARPPFIKNPCLLAPLAPHSRDIESNETLHDVRCGFCHELVSRMVSWLDNFSVMR